MQQKFTLPQKNLLVLKISIICFLFFSIWQIGCRKTDLKPADKNYSAGVRDFFKDKDEVSPQVQRVMVELQRQNNSSGNSFVKSTTGKHGYAKWDKSFMQIRKPKYATSFSKNSLAGADTIVIVPLVKDDDTQVNAYLEAHLTDEVKINLRTAGEYRKLVQKGKNNKTKAEDMSLIFMDLTRIVLGTEKFEITDNRLFSLENSIKDSGHLPRIHFNENSNSLVSQHCVTINIEVKCVEKIPTLTGTGTNNLGADIVVVPEICFYSYERCNWYEGGGGGDSGPYDDGGGPGGGNPGGGDTGGGGPVGTGDDPCSGNGLIINGVLPPDPCGTGGADEPGWLPFVEDEDIVFGQPIPPFIWSYQSKDDDGKIYIDNYPLNKPNFQFLSSDNYESKYPKFTELVKNLKSFTMSNRKVMAALKKWSNLSEEKIIEYLSFGNGPIIKIGSRPGALGWYQSDKNPAILYVRDYYVNLLENTPSLYVKEALAFLLSVTVLHEFVHFGAHMNGISEGGYEFGQQFEKEAFNVVVSATNMSNLYLDFYKYY